MKVAFIDMIGGAAGDMLMGAWVDAGVDVAALERGLRSVVADGWELVTERVERGGISAIHLDLVIPGEDDHGHDEHGVHVHYAHHGHALNDVIAIVERSSLKPRQIEQASEIYRRLADVEARVSGRNAADMVFHDVGQIDAILDVAGTCIALDLLGIEDVRCSAFPIGHGLTQTGRGGKPNPSPEALDLMRGFPTATRDANAELVTVTGAAIVSTIARPGPALGMTLERIGYGAGRKQFAFPNVVRVTVGERT